MALILSAHALRAAAKVAQTICRSTLKTWRPIQQRPSPIANVSGRSSYITSSAQAVHVNAGSAALEVSPSHVMSRALEAES
jgi:hypothetical protein